MCENHSWTSRDKHSKWLFRVDLRTNEKTFFFFWNKAKAKPHEFKCSNQITHIFFETKKASIECNYAMAKSNYSTKSISCYQDRAISSVALRFYRLCMCAKVAYSAHTNCTNSFTMRVRVRGEENMVNMHSSDIVIAAYQPICVYVLYMHHRRDERRKKNVNWRIYHWRFFSSSHCTLVLLGGRKERRFFSILHSPKSNVETTTVLSYSHVKLLHWIP